jgi:uncharacterized membrane protein
MVSEIAVALLFGVVAGMRAVTAPAIYFLARGPLAAGIVLAVLAVVELVGDKLPSTPARTRPMPLAFRLLSGAIVGCFVGSAGGAHGWTGFPAMSVSSGQVVGAVAGIVGAVIGTYGGYYARIAAVRRIGALPSAFFEDALAIGLGIFAITR